MNGFGWVDRVLRRNAVNSAPKVTEWHRHLDDGPRTVPVDLQDDGLLWLINRVVFHPRGFALAYDRASGSFELWGNGDEPWRYGFTEAEEDQLFETVEAAFSRVRSPMAHLTLGERPPIMRTTPE